MMKFTLKSTFLWPTFERNKNTKRFDFQPWLSDERFQRAEIRNFHEHLEVSENKFR